MSEITEGSASKLLVIFIEGDTEVEFYKKLVGTIRSNNGGTLLCKVAIRNAKGIGNYQSKVCRVFEKDIKVKNPGMRYEVVLCYDSDVFEFERKPPVDWDNVTKALIESGASRVEQIKAITSIEDWFLYDMNGLRRFLHISKKQKLPVLKGQKGLSKLFQIGKKNYIKGVRCNGLIDALDIDVIEPHIRDQISILYEMLMD